LVGSVAPIARSAVSVTSRAVASPDSNSSKIVEVESNMFGKIPGK